MRVYFLSDRPCILVIGGLYLGGVDGHERSVEIDPADALLCEFKCPGFQALSFVFDEHLLLVPPPHVRVYHGKNGVALFIHDFLRADPAMRPVRQARLGNTLLTLYVQGRLQLSLENPTGLHVLDLPDALEQATFAQSGEYFLLEAPTAFCLVDPTGTLVLQSEGTVLDRGQPLTAEVPFHDSLGHTALCSWVGAKLTACSVRARSQPTAATFALALFESALVGADLTPFLAENLLPKAASLGAYLGAYTAVVPTAAADTVGLVYPRSARVFDVRYFRVTLLPEGKIANITPL